MVERVDRLVMDATAMLAELQLATATEALLAAQMVGAQRLAMLCLRQATCANLAMGRSTPVGKRKNRGYTLSSLRQPRRPAPISPIPRRAKDPGSGTGPGNRAKSILKAPLPMEVNENSGPALASARNAYVPGIRTPRRTISALKPSPARAAR